MNCLFFSSVLFWQGIIFESTIACRNQKFSSFFRKFLATFALLRKCFSPIVKMHSTLLYILLWLVSLSLQQEDQPSSADVLKQAVIDSSVSEWRGFFRREHSLIKPYQSRPFTCLKFICIHLATGLDIPNWNVVGSTMVSQQQIRLTGDIQSRKGAIWNTNVGFFICGQLYSFFSLFGLKIGN